MKHVPVLLNSVLETLGDIHGKSIVDCTFGAGGYSRAFLERGAQVVAFDRDPSVADAAEKLKAEFGDNFQFINRPFSELSELAPKLFDGIVFDFGISSMQIDTPTRGFSWRFDAPLDMRMGQNQMTAADMINDIDIPELARILRDYGDLKNARSIAAALKKHTPKTTFALRDIIHNPKDIAPVFQALRIAVNDELGEIERALAAVPALLARGGICAAVSFHSIEDRLVKNTFRKWTTDIGDPRFPIASADFQQLKTYRPTDTEIKENPRARSAHLRAVIKK